MDETAYTDEQIEEIILRSHPGIRKLGEGTYIIGNVTLNDMKDDAAEKIMDEIGSAMDNPDRVSSNKDDKWLCHMLWALFDYFYLHSPKYSNREGGSWVKYYVNDNEGGTVASGEYVTYFDFVDAYCENMDICIRNFNASKGSFIGYFIDNMGYCIRNIHNKQVDINTYEKELKVNDEDNNADLMEEVFEDESAGERFDQTLYEFDFIELARMQVKLQEQLTENDGLKVSEKKKLRKHTTFYTGLVTDFLKVDMSGASGKNPSAASLYNLMYSAIKQHRRDVWDGINYEFNEFTYIEKPQNIDDMEKIRLKTNGEMFGNKAAKTKVDKVIDVPLQNNVYALYLDVSEPQVKNDKDLFYQTVKQYLA